MAYYDFILLQKIKRFVRSHKFFIIFSVVLILLFIFVNKCFAAFGGYGNYYNMSDETITAINSAISLYHENYDSFIARYLQGGSSGKIAIYFYNYSDAGRLHLATQNGINADRYCYINSENSSTYKLITLNDDYSINVETERTGIISVITDPQFTNVDPNLSLSKIYLNQMVYTYDFNNIQFAGTGLNLDPSYINPSFITTQSQLNNISNLENLEINPGTFEDDIYLKLCTSNGGVLFSEKLTTYEDFIERQDLSNPFSNLIYRIPLSSLPSFNLSAGSTYEFRLSYIDYYQDSATVSLSFTPNVSYQAENNNSTQINSAINKTNEKIDQTNQELSDINDNLTNSDINSVSAGDLPTVSVNDPTENGIGTIFQNMYNAFCTGNPQDIVFPIPFVNKSITLSPNYIYNMLHNNNADWVITFIQAFWAFLFGRFIIKDMAGKIMKIKNGNIENLQNDNIKMEMM